MNTPRLVLLIYCSHLPYSITWILGKYADLFTRSQCITIFYVQMVQTYGKIFPIRP